VLALVQIQRCRSAPSRLLARTLCAIANE